MYWTGRLSTLPRTRVAHASSKVTPDMDVIKSIRFGSFPSCTTRFEVVKSSIERGKLPKPKSWSAASRCSAFSTSARMKKSISAEYRGNPYQETASAPTIRYSTLREFKHSTNSRKSGLSGIGSTPLLNCEEDVDPLLRRQIPTRQNVRRIGLRKGFEDGCYFLHRFTSLA